MLAQRKPLYMPVAETGCKCVHSAKCEIYCKHRTLCLLFTTNVKVNY